MFKLAVFLAIVACAFAAPEPAPGYVAPVAYAGVPTAYAAPAIAYSAYSAPLAYSTYGAGALPLAYRAHYY